ncbi:MAG: RNA polymerase sigma factor [gamma proteobacterium symbiont of Bathyaustriella thionipta]|nr:RNA polymerase sigma factor [gamma proteobacterium symbiont of Bathyaustriella thionipta]MCU7950790.1 RNA polymerase sigma factor [gamma proteobacterium symbiont of Bathyaustriella thionipta]MCU7953156.1 RNA polymerase sigma factor [gamma proteobacterium symbiont of Bathyaustriella thionipta]MCU7957303.1 RNA polymerase sigma factor [gamma proteobacterium symbiont of Bathyaustriella thionipta]MCU7966323.1 RNA polymerase sigma factor [gamma proteobacterium symbiont of Bathyaustriella thionipta
MSILQFCLPDKHLGKKLEQCRNKMFRIAFSWCHNEMLADDLVQDTLTRALLRQNQLKKTDVLESWVIAIMNNVWRDHLRRQKEFIDIDEHIYLNNETPENIHERERIIQRVREAISLLPMGQRQVISLVDLEGMSYNEVSQILEIPVGTVMSRLNRARNAMMNKLSNENNESQVVSLHQQQHRLKKDHV